MLCFYLGYFSLSRVQRLWPFWLGLLGGFLLVLAVGWEQQFGGLKESRRYFFLYVYPQMKEVPPEYLKKISSNRIFATLFYPNTLAGVLLLLLPAALAALWQLRRLLTPAARGFLMALVGIAGLACLYWSGSKGGWLLMLLLGLVALLRVPFSRRLKIALVTGVLLAGLAGFFLRHAAFFQKGATSVSARFDYWRAAVQTAKDKPVFGTGPGTFAIAYAEDQAARVRDGAAGAQRLPGAGLRLGGGGVAGLRACSSCARLGVELPEGRQRLRPRESDDWLTFAVWLGVLGWSLQSLVEFGLYIPALAWPAFTFLGWLLGKDLSVPVPGAPRPSPVPARRIPFDKPGQTA